MPAVRTIRRGCHNKDRQRRDKIKRGIGADLCRDPRIGAIPPNQRWSLGFVSDSFVCGRRFRILCVVEDLSRKCQALVTDAAI